MLYQADCDPGLLAGRRLAVFGYGAQARAQAANLRDGGHDVVVALRDGSASRAAALAAGHAVTDPASAVTTADVVLLLIPDTAHAAVWEQVLRPGLRPQALVAFAHGYSLLYGDLALRSDVDLVLVAPLGVGEQVRASFTAGGGVPGLVAVHHDATGTARARALALAAAQGHGRAGIIETTVREETETDLFAEQAVLCGGMDHLVTAAFETLVEAGYAPEIAYFCCLHEVAAVASLMQERGIAGMRESISPVAEFGDYTRGPRVVGEATRAELRRMLDEIRSGAFAAELARESAGGGALVQRGRAAARAHLIEQVGARLRAGMRRR